MYECQYYRVLDIHNLGSQNCLLSLFVLSTFYDTMWILLLDSQLKVLDANSKEADFARTALFAKHPEMKGRRINLLTSPSSFFDHLIFLHFCC